MNVRSSRALALCRFSAAVAVSMMTCPSAEAESSATLYGLVGLDVASTKRSDGPPRSFAEQSPGLTAPFWGLRITEELGGGYRVVAALESFFQPVNGGIGRTSADPLWGRNAYVGIAGPFGTVTLGRQTNLLYLAEQAVNPFQASILFSPLVMQTFTAPYGGAIAGDTVWNNAIQYRTPNLNGLTATAVFAPGGIAGSDSTFNAGLSTLYANGSLTAVATVQRTRVVAGVAAPTQIAYIAGAAYDFSRFKLYGALQGTRTDATDISTKTYEAGLALPLTSRFSILAEWAYTHRSATRGVTSSRNTGTAGLDYFLSKRTDVYLLGVYDRLAGHATAMTYATGIRHSF
ncbi:porin [Paraburkholderia saeva]|uniref:porin n=1 Tax=Paraburkholderia saeva TaxID=2777537 RepID=UPI001D3D9C25|nr:porin [Paraburkholderia saeva]CAG4921338.1 Outer membrane porin protein [Paraburkholderia saeva]CAG4922931.1 Outer membrane porin protein [Paraburkholderia saeva]